MVAQSLLSFSSGEINRWTSVTPCDKSLGASKFLIRSPSHVDEFASLEVEGLSDKFLNAGVYQMINEFIGLGHQKHGDARFDSFGLHIGDSSQTNRVGWAERLESTSYILVVGGHRHVDLNPPAILLDLSKQIAVPNYIRAARLYDQLGAVPFGQLQVAHESG